MITLTEGRSTCRYTYMNDHNASALLPIESKFQDRFCPNIPRADTWSAFRTSINDIRGGIRGILLYRYTAAFQEDTKWYVEKTFVTVLIFLVDFNQPELLSPSLEEYLTNKNALTRLRLIPPTRDEKHDFHLNAAFVFCTTKIKALPNNKDPCRFKVYS